MRYRRGIAALELLVVAPVLIVLFLGFISLTIAASLRGDLAMVTRAAMQYAMQDLTTSEDLAGIAAAGESAAIGLPVTPEVEVIEWCACMNPTTGELTPVDCSTNSCPAADPSPHRYLRINASADYPYPWDVPGLPSIWQLTARAELRTK
ncbi:MAG: hypothetical protein RL321_1696 [Pseudomonadota bacterium]|jgi:hypothetical protein